MKSVLNKEKLVEFSKKLLNYGVICGALVAGFGLGKYYASHEPKPTDNPYSHAFSPEEISIAVNESNELILIERKTGKYIVYSDEIGMTVFKMYTNRIYQNANENE
jgi:hypothetical protein